MIDIAFHGLRPHQVAAIIAALESVAKISDQEPDFMTGHTPHSGPMVNEFTQVVGDQNFDAGHNPNTAPVQIPGYVVPQVIQGTVNQTPYNPETDSKPYDPNTAASVFGAKVVRQEQALQQVYAPPGSVVMGQQSPQNQPAPSVVGGTPAPVGAVDSKGRQWDARIHSSSKEKLAKTGEWKLKRGVDKNLVVVVEHELDTLKGASSASTPLAGVTRFNDQPVTQGYTVGQPHVAPAPMPHPQQGYYAPQAPVPTGPSYTDVVEKITNAIADNRVPAQTVQAMFAHFQIVDMDDLQRHENVFPILISEIDRLSAGV